MKRLFIASITFLILFVSSSVIYVAYDYKRFFDGKVRQARNANDIAEMTIWNDSRGVQLWISRGGNPNNKGLLDMATGPKGGHEVLKVLVKSGLDINEITYDYTPLMNAASWCNYEAVKYLLEQGADANIKNSKGKTAYDLTSSRLDCEKIRHLLKKYENKK